MWRNVLPAVRDAEEGEPGAVTQLDGLRLAGVRRRTVAKDVGCGASDPSRQNEKRAAKQYSCFQWMIFRDKSVARPPPRLPVKHKLA
jgi:hypothetical protein